MVRSSVGCKLPHSGTFSSSELHFNVAFRHACAQTILSYPAGSILGVTSAAYYFPKIVMPPIVALCNDKLGRRMPILFGAILTGIGALVVTFANNQNTFIGGRVLLGAGYR
jgi:MFS family permease